ncbi:MAG: putative ABC transporter permease subunit [Massilia sp.]
MKLAPGSSLWLLRHELRLLLYHTLLNGKKNAAERRVDKRTMGWLVGLWLIFHAGAFGLMHLLGKAGAPLPPQLAAGVTLLLAGIFMLMLSGGLKSSVEALFDRGDLDLLLSSPLPSRSILTVRLAGIIIGIVSTYLFFLAPFAHVGLVLGQFRWLGIYPTIIGMATIAASAAILLTLALVRLVGARRTRVIAQVIGAIAGALMFLLSQLFNVMSHSSQAATTQRLARWFAPDGPLGPASAAWLPGRAALGEPGPQLGMALLAAAAFFLTVRFTHSFFVRGLQQAAGAGRAAKAPPGGVRYRFGRGLAEAVVVKEWRLIMRDTHLISQTLLQLLYLLPVCFLIISEPSLRTSGIATGLTMLCASLGASLTWIMVQAEDAPDLLLASPADPRLIGLAKLAAAVMPPLLLVAVPLLWLLARNPVAGLLTSFTVVGAVIGAALIVLWSGRPAQRSGFQRRGHKNMVGMMLEVANTLAWAGLAYLLLSSLTSVPSTVEIALAGGLFVVTLALPLFAWLRRGPQRGSRAPGDR